MLVVIAHKRSVFDPHPPEWRLWVSPFSVISADMVPRTFRQAGSVSNAERQDGKNAPFLNDKSLSKARKASDIQPSYQACGLGLQLVLEPACRSTQRLSTGR